MHADGHTTVWGTHIGVGRTTDGKGWYQQVKEWWAAHKTAAVSKPVPSKHAGRCSGSLAVVPLDSVHRYRHGGVTTFLSSRRPCLLSVQHIKAGPIRAIGMCPRTIRADEGPLTPTTHVTSGYPSCQAVFLRTAFFVDPHH